MSAASCVYVGDVVHRRLAPVRHELRYRVYNLFVDVDELPHLHSTLRLLSYNRPNVFAIHDRDHGPGDGTPIADHAWAIVRNAEQAGAVKRIFMLTYPRILGYVFNPITVYYCFNDDAQLCLMIYEVNNTFGERHTYVIAMDGTGQHGCRKSFHVSPFNQVEGDYSFSLSVPDDKLKLAITLTKPDGPQLSAWFRGDRRPLNDRSLIRSFLSLPLQPVKVIAGIHIEAAKLWLKGLKINPKPLPPAQAVSFEPTEPRQK